MNHVANASFVSMSPSSLTCGSVTELIDGLKDSEEPVLREAPDARHQAIGLCKSLLNALELPEEQVIRVTWTEMSTTLDVLSVG